MKTISRFVPQERGTALITGASSGIGLALATEFARNGHPLVITAREESELQAVSQQLMASYHVGVRTIAADLEDKDAASEIFDFIHDNEIEVKILVNNAGLGHWGKFWKIPLNDQLSIVRVNIEALVRLTHLFLPGMVLKRSGRILNTASIAGFEPGPSLAVYHASKAFVLSLSEALATELEESGVTVTALCPGATDTDFFPKAHMIETKAFQKTKVMAPQEVAEIAYKACLKGERTVVPGSANKAIVFARRFLSEGAQAKQNKKLYEKVPLAERKRHRGDIEFA